MTDLERLRRHAASLRRIDDNLVTFGTGEPGLPLTGLGLDGGAVADVLDRALARLFALDMWLETRGLPATWSGPLDAWGWVVFGNDAEHGSVVVGYVTGDCLETAWQNAAQILGKFPKFLHRWDKAPPRQRAEALRIEGEGKC